MSHAPITVAAILGLTLAVAGCPDGTGPGETAETATLTHDGFDFSAGMADTDNYQNNDGDVIPWQPGLSGESPANTLWWRNDQTTTDGSNATVDMGAMELSSVTSIPSQFEAPPDISPLQVGHVYVAKCHDGWVKFRVTALDTRNWTATVDYVFTTGASF